MTIEKELQALISKEIEKQLVNRHIASKSFVISSITTDIHSLQILVNTISSELSKRLDSQQKQINKLFALIDEGRKEAEIDAIIEQQHKPKLPRVGQLCYVWDKPTSTKKIRRFEYFSESLGKQLFIDKQLEPWNHWSFIPTEDIL